MHKSQKKEKGSRGAWKELFSKYDTDGSGQLEMFEFKEFWNEIDPSIPETAIELLFHIADGDGTGKIEYDEFADCLDYIS